MAGSSAPQSPLPTTKQEFPLSVNPSSLYHHPNGFSVMSMALSESQQPPMNTLPTGNTMYQHHPTATSQMHGGPAMFTNTSSSYKLYSPPHLVSQHHNNSTTATVQQSQTQQVFAYSMPSVPCSTSTFITAQDDNLSDM